MNTSGFGRIAATLLLTAALPCAARTPPVATTGDDSMRLTCLFASTSDPHARQTLDISFSPSRQAVEVGPDRQSFAAQITDASITFSVGQAPEQVYFSIDRRTGSITVSGSFSVLQTGQCRLADSHAAK